MITLRSAHRAGVDHHHGALGHVCARAAALPPPGRLAWRSSRGWPAARRLGCSAPVGWPPPAPQLAPQGVLSVAAYPLRGWAALAAAWRVLRSLPQLSIFHISAISLLLSTPAAIVHYVDLTAPNTDAHFAPLTCPCCCCCTDLRCCCAFILRIFRISGLRSRRSWTQTGGARSTESGG